MARIFISFDYDNDAELAHTLVGQAKQQDSPFSIKDCSLREPITEKWRAKVRDLIRAADLVIVICGKHTDVASGVAAELSITREEKKPYFLLRGRPNDTCKKPRMALKEDKIYKWAWKNLAMFVAGER